MVQARINLNRYSNKVLAVIKAKYELKDKSQAINKFIERHGPEEVERKVKEEYLKKILKMEKEYYKRHGYNKRTSVEELRREIEGE